MHIKGKQFATRKILLFGVLIIVIGLISFTSYYYHQYQQIRNNPDIITEKELESITTSINRFMDLPEDETPTLATITDKEELSDQQFFKKAEVGDKVLIYTKSLKAILYRPSSKRVIEFAPLILDIQDQEDQL